MCVYLQWSKEEGGASLSLSLSPQAAASALHARLRINTIVVACFDLNRWASSGTTAPCSSTYLRACAWLVACRSTHAGCLRMGCLLACIHSSSDGPHLASRRHAVLCGGLRGGCRPAGQVSACVAYSMCTDTDTDTDIHRERETESDRHGEALSLCLSVSFSVCLCLPPSLSLFITHTLTNTHTCIYYRAMARYEELFEQPATEEAIWRAAALYRLHGA